MLKSPLKTSLQRIKKCCLPATITATTTCCCSDGNISSISATLRGNRTKHGGHYGFNSAITRRSSIPFAKPLQDDYGLHPPACFSFISFAPSSTFFPSQFPCSTSATQTTTWMRARAMWRCRCGGRGPISPRREPSQCAPERQILFQLRVRVGAQSLSPALLASKF